MPNTYAPSHTTSFPPSSASFPLASSATRFDSPKPRTSVKRIDFPVKPHLLKYLQVHLELERIQEAPLKLADYVLSTGNKRFGLALSHLLRKPVKSARHEESNEECTSVLGIDLRNYKNSYYDLEHGKLSPYAIFEFNDLVEEYFREELYWWVRQHYKLRATIKDAIRSYMAFYDVTEDDIAYETLRKSVQRNVELPGRKKNRKKTSDFSVNVSQKIGGVSRKTAVMSQKIGVLSHKDTYNAVREQLMKLPLPLFETQFFQHTNGGR
jgi:hypothetical protein